MSWVGEKDRWLPGTVKPPRRRARRPQRPRARRIERLYSVSEVADLLSVSRQTVFKWLSIDAPEDAVIPPAGWFRLPGGDIRIRESALLELMGGGGA